MTLTSGPAFVWNAGQTKSLIGQCTCPQPLAPASCFCPRYRWFPSHTSLPFPAEWDCICSACPSTLYCTSSAFGQALQSELILWVECFRGSHLRPVFKTEQTRALSTLVLSSVGFKPFWPASFVRLVSLSTPFLCLKAFPPRTVSYSFLSWFKSKCH